MKSPDYEILEFGEQGLSAEGVRDVARLHAELLGHSPLVLMGPEFVEQFYYTVLPREGFIRGAVAYVDGRIAGFIVGTDDADGFMARAAKKHWLRIGWIMFKSVLRNPSRILAIKEAYQIQSNVQTQDHGQEAGELLSFGVLPEFRSRRFIKETALLVSSDLLNIAIGQLEKLGKRRLRAIVDKDNLEAQLFYRSHGWRVGLKSVKGWRVPSMEFLLDLE